jgi:lipoyl(octanoyl) transferase
MAYGEAHRLQERLVDARVAGRIDDTLLLVEHPPVFTLGRAAKAEHILRPKDALESLGFEVHETGRGGDVTYHGPGQLVGYPIVDLRPDRTDVRKYVASLEETMIRTVATYGITAGRISGLNGTWVGDRKIGAVGVRIRHWVTMHGFALNVTTDLRHFQLIVPCGITNKDVTSIARETGEEKTLEEVSGLVVEKLAELYEAGVTWHDGAPLIPEDDA